MPLSHSAGAWHKLPSLSLSFFISGIGTVMCASGVVVYIRIALPAPGKLLLEWGQAGRR